MLVGSANHAVKDNDALLLGLEEEVDLRTTIKEFLASYDSFIAIEYELDRTTE